MDTLDPSGGGDARPDPFDLDRLADDGNPHIDPHDMTSLPVSPSNTRRYCHDPP